uniref:Uncharacterized protein n=1 Tax=Anguilla anguilla TaxID=7936 RepID=A0A0E9W4Y5_ANGAN
MAASLFKKMVPAAFLRQGLLCNQMLFSPCHDLSKPLYTTS